MFINLHQLHNYKTPLDKPFIAFKMLINYATNAVKNGR